jgi:hypothetical protein
MTVTASTIVVYCYQMRDTGDITLTHHTVVNDKIENFTATDRASAQGEALSMLAVLADYDVDQAKNPWSAHAETLRCAQGDR